MSWGQRFAMSGEHLSNNFWVGHYICHNRTPWGRRHHNCGIPITTADPHAAATGCIDSWHVYIRRSIKTSWRRSPKSCAMFHVTTFNGPTTRKNESAGVASRPLPMHWHPKPDSACESIIQRCQHSLLAFILFATPAWDAPLSRLPLAAATAIPPRPAVAGGKLGVRSRFVLLVPCLCRIRRNGSSRYVSRFEVFRACAVYLAVPTNPAPTPCDLPYALPAPRPVNPCASMLHTGQGALLLVSPASLTPHTSPATAPPTRVLCLSPRDGLVPSRPRRARWRPAGVHRARHRARRPHAPRRGGAHSTPTKSSRSPSNGPSRCATPSTHSTRRRSNASGSARRRRARSGRCQGASTPGGVNHSSLPQYTCFCLGVYVSWRCFQFDHGPCSCVVFGGGPDELPTGGP